MHLYLNFKPNQEQGQGSHQPEQVVRGSNLGPANLILKIC